MNAVYPIRVALISDIHANFFALDAVIHDLREHVQPDRIIGLGDFVFGGPQPAETVARLREVCDLGIAGNTDPWITGAVIPGQKHVALAEWAAQRLRPDDLDWLRTLPSAIDRADLPGLLGVHATPRRDDETVLPTADEATFAAAFGGTNAEIIACGHVHRPYVRAVGSTTVVGVGSVGFPWDNDRRACYAVLTRENGRWMAEHRRVDYDAGATIRSMHESGMPNTEERAQLLAGRDA